MRKEVTDAKQKRGDVSLIVLSAVYCGLVVLLIFAMIAGNLLNMPLESFTADPAVTYGGHPFTGMISNIGVLLWCATAVICLFSSAFLNTLRPEGRGDDFFFLLCSGLISLFLLLDDLFMFHEAIFPWYLNIPQPLVYVLYLALMSAYFLYFRKRMMKGEFKIFSIAVTFFVLSVAGDFLLPQQGLAYVIEDSLKVFGIAAWFIYFTAESFNAITGESAVTINKPQVF